MVAASIRSKNPGAMWGRTGKRPSADKFVATNAPIPLRWGSKTTEYLGDGLGQGNNIAYFNTYEDGICAQLDLWRTSAKYRNKPFEEAIAVWSGGNNVESYISYVLRRIPGMTRSTVMNDEFWRGPMGLAFLRAQAAHEAGQEYPAAASDWSAAQQRYWTGVKKTTQKIVVAATTAGTTTTTVAAQQAAASGAHPGLVALIVIAGIALTVFGIWWFRFRKR